MELKQNEVFNQEIADLEAKLAAKKQEMLQAGVEKTEQQVFKEVVRDHAFASEDPSTTAPTTSTASDNSARTTTDRDEATIAPMIAHAFVKGIASAVAEARKLGDPYLIDLLHDRLADEYYQKLVAARKVQP